MILLAGPFGVGKTRVREELGLPLPVVDTPSLIRRNLPAATDRAHPRRDDPPEHLKRAVRTASARAFAQSEAAIASHVDNHRSFIWETPISGRKPGAYTPLNAREKGYDLELLFVGLEEWEDTASRVDPDSPDHAANIVIMEVLRNFFFSNFTNLGPAARQCTTGAIYDNAGGIPAPVAAIQGGKALVHEERGRPPWLGTAGLKIEYVPEERFLAALGKRVFHPDPEYGEDVRHAPPSPRPPPAMIRHQHP